MAKYISLADTAKLVRKSLKEQFPGTKFSVRSNRYGTIRVEWIDGPSETRVSNLVKKFEGATFDSMVDLKSYVTREFEGEEVQFGADYVCPVRHLSRAFCEAIVSQFCAQFGIPLLPVEGTEHAYVDTRSLNYSMERWLQELLRTTDAKDMHRAYAAEEEREEQRRAEAPERERRRQEQEKKQEAERKRREEEARRYQEELRRRQEQAAKEEKEREERARKAEQERQKQARQRTQKIHTREQALAYLGLSFSADRAAIVKAFREKVKQAADGKGGYRGDMDLLVKAKEKALQ